MSDAGQARLLADALAELAALSVHPVDVTELVHVACERACAVLAAEGSIVLLSRDGEQLEPAGSHGVVDGDPVLSMPLRRGDAAFGRLSVVRRDGKALTAWEQEAARQLADVVAAALVHEQELAAARAVTAQLEHALQARVVVEQAKGMVAAELGVSIDDALEMLRTFARSQRLRLADVAQDVVDRRLPMALLRWSR